MFAEALQELEVDVKALAASHQLAVSLHTHSSNQEAMEVEFSSQQVLPLVASAAVNLLPLEEQLAVWSQGKILLDWLQCTGGRKLNQSEVEKFVNFSVNHTVQSTIGLSAWKMVIMCMV